MLEKLEHKPRAVSFILWFISFMAPFYILGVGFTYDQNLVWEILSSAIIYKLITYIWPCLILHLAAYTLIYPTFKRQGYTRYFLAYAGILYTLIAVGQATAYIDGKPAIMVSNLVLTLLVVALWLRDSYKPVNLEGKGKNWFLPLALFAFTAPRSAAKYSPPWFWMWETAIKQPILVIPALALDSLAGYGTLAYCLFTPLALTVAGKTGSVRPLTLRLTSLLGVAYSSIIWISTLVKLITGQYPSGWFPILWNAILHLPLLIICTYYFLVKWEKQ